MGDLPSWQAGETVAACIGYAQDMRGWLTLRHAPREATKRPHQLANWARRNHLNSGTVDYTRRDGAPEVGLTKMEVFEDGIPTFQKAGTIIPRKDRFRRSSTQMVNDPYTLVIALNSSKSAEGELYIDDGKSFEYEEGAFMHRQFVFSDNKLVYEADFSNSLLFYLFFCHNHFY
ncbi:putative glucan 1,3-alpha-glucosidase [Carex littledalei]|uniref:Putative glucan 1,3-alpha-glucosidase n=1 Tax=Carex littledalei TaxID=544730 RepID=A0A833RBT4_9POAL|nr:putative glucan 1,3-alpha-glucosidase [Carex littledalei]